MAHETVLAFRKMVSRIGCDTFDAQLHHLVDHSGVTWTCRERHSTRCAGGLPAPLPGCVSYWVLAHSACGRSRRQLFGGPSPGRFSANDRWLGGACNGLFVTHCSFW